MYRYTILIYLTTRTVKQYKLFSDINEKKKLNPKIDENEIQYTDRNYDSKLICKAEKSVFLMYLVLE